MEDLKDFSKMWLQTMGILAAFLGGCAMLVLVLIGLAKLFAVAAPWVGSILVFLGITLVITAWGWLTGVRP